MRKNIEISEDKIKEFLEQFYGYFESGYAFEEFLKVYLEKIGLDEVVVTQRSSDGGIDLEAVRYGVGGLTSKDLTIAKNRCYLAGVTELYKDSGLIAEDGSYNPCKAIWKYSEDQIEIVIKER